MKMCFRSNVPAIRPRSRFETRVPLEYIYIYVCYISSSLGNQRSIDFPFVPCHFFPSPSLLSSLHRAEIVTSFHSISSARHRHPANPRQPFFSVSPSFSLSFSLLLDPGERERGESLLISAERPQDSFRARNKAFTRSRCVTRLMKSYPFSSPPLPIDSCSRWRVQPTRIASINCNRLFFAQDRVGRITELFSISFVTFDSFQSCILYKTTGL